MTEKSTQELAEHIKKRTARSRLFGKIMIGMSFLTLIPLFAIIIQVFLNGFRRLNLDLITQLQPTPSATDGGVLNAIVGSVMILVIALAMALPIALLTGIFIAELGKQKKYAFITSFIYSSCNILQSMPAIVVGMVVYAWVVQPMRGFSMLSGSIALGLMMLPYITINTVEVMKLIPDVIREAGYALGGNFYKVVMKVVIPIALPGIINGIFISVGRVIGEAAPLLFTSFGNPFLSFNPLEPVAALPVVIFQFSISPYENWQDVGWGASLILLLSIIVINVFSKRLSKKLSVY